MESIGEQVGIDPLLAIAIVRQESRFNPEAKSLAAARGLMQVVPVTFERLRQDLKRPELKLEQLHQPEVGLELGMTYLKYLGERFGGRPELVVAAYNGGPENVDRWMSQARSDDLLDFLAVISFKETRDYVRIVIDNWWVYCDLYRDGQEPPRRMLTAAANPAPPEKGVWMPASPAATPPAAPAP
jgi:soluble lytic murein transglycosylase